MPLRLHDCSILHASELPACNARLDKHFIGYCSLQFMSAGRIELAYNRRRLLLAGPSVWPCNPGPRIQFHPAAGETSWHHHHIALRGPLLDEWRSAGLWPNDAQAAPTDPEFPALFRRMVACAKDATRHLLAINLLEQILLLLAEDRREPIAEAWVDRAKRLLGEAGTYPVDIGAVATAVDLPASTFRRRFHAAVGMSPRDYALIRRMERARERLLGSDDAIATIAEDLGYNDVFFFSKQFTQKTGLSPTTFRATRS